MPNPICIEVALNGPWTRRVQPTMPESPDEIVADAVACARAGAFLMVFFPSLVMVPMRWFTG